MFVPFALSSASPHPTTLTNRRKTGGGDRERDSEGAKKEDEDR